MKTTIDREVLEQCPFCGAGQTEITENGKTWTGMKYSQPTSVSVRHWCEKVEGQPSRMLERVGKDRASAIAAWNTRAALAVQQEPQSHRERWNIEHLEDGSLQVCFNLHDKGEKCDYQRFVPDSTAPPAPVVPQGLLDALDEFSQHLEELARAYPLSIFPEPDLAKAHQALQAVGMTLDAISASSMRHVVTTINKDFDAVRAALSAAPTPGEG